jgi:hypothetical protein
MTEQSPVAAPPPAEHDDDEDYGKSILGELRKLNGRLDQWGDLLTQETQTETSSDPAIPDTTNSGEMPTRASSETTNPPANSQTSESTSPAGPEGDSSSETPTVDPTPVPNRAAEAKSQTARKSLGFLGKKKPAPNR